MDYENALPAVAAIFNDDKFNCDAKKYGVKPGFAMDTAPNQAHSTPAQGALKFKGTDGERREAHQGSSWSKTMWTTSPSSLSTIAVG